MRTFGLRDGRGAHLEFVSMELKNRPCVVSRDYEGEIGIIGLRSVSAFLIPPEEAAHRR